MARVALTEHIGEIIVRARKNANKAKGPFRMKYTHRGTIETAATLDAEGEIQLDVSVPTVGNADGSADIEVGRDAEGTHEFEIEVETFNDDWVSMVQG